METAIGEGNQPIFHTTPLMAARDEVSPLAPGPKGREPIPCPLSSLSRPPDPPPPRPPRFSPHPAAQLGLDVCVKHVAKALFETKMLRPGRELVLSLGLKKFEAAEVKAVAGFVKRAVAQAASA